MNGDELWRIVPSLPGLMASSKGRLMVIPYMKPMPHGGLRWYGGYPTKGQWAKKERRYNYVYKGKTYRAHRLICEAFNGAPSEITPVAMHLDEDGSNNDPKNLKWGTQAENLNAPGFIQYCKSRTGDKNPRKKGMRASP